MIYFLSFVLMFFYLDSTTSSLVYTEGSELVCISPLNVHVANSSCFSTVSFSNFKVFILPSFFYGLYESTVYFFWKLLHIYLYGCKHRFRLTGRGYYMYNKGNILYLKLGFSHVVKSIFCFNVLVNNKIKKKKFWSISSFSYSSVKHDLYKIRSLRGPNLYSKRVKGVYVKNEFIPRGTFSFNKF